MEGHQEYSGPGGDDDGNSPESHDSSRTATPAHDDSPNHPDAGGGINGDDEEQEAEQSMKERLENQERLLARRSGDTPQLITELLHLEVESTQSAMAQLHARSGVSSSALICGVGGKPITRPSMGVSMFSPDQSLMYGQQQTTGAAGEYSVRQFARPAPPQQRRLVEDMFNESSTSQGASEYRDSLSASTTVMSSSAAPRRQPAHLNLEELAARRRGQFVHTGGAAGGGADDHGGYSATGRWPLVENPPCARTARPPQREHSPDILAERPPPHRARQSLYHHIPELAPNLGYVQEQLSPREVHLSPRPAPLSPDQSNDSIERHHQVALLAQREEEEKATGEHARIQRKRPTRTMTAEMGEASSRGMRRHNLAKQREEVQEVIARRREAERALRRPPMPHLRAHVADKTVTSQQAQGPERPQWAMSLDLGQAPQLAALGPLSAAFTVKRAGK